MRKTIVKFHCDNCGKELTRIKNGNDRDFPWDEGWVELNGLEVGAPVKATHRLIDQPHRIQITDRDFCSDRCFIDFINKELVEASIVRTKPLHRDEGEQLYPPLHDEEDEVIVPKPSRSPYQDPMPPHDNKIYVHEGPAPEVRFQQPQPPQPPQEERIEEVQEPKRRRGFFG